MIDPDKDEEAQAARVIAEMIADYRQECLDAMRDAIIRECDAIIENGFDPARGRGRGPLWADGD